ncbi:unnamed protein product [Cyclocybe aegerita]|uniref:Uncharacterized protein n=1 Tax=Cyclocybe aegerita TaxID=1973307 RepID=A0A8S0W265_CYCAE|nr:unnamed protein product [Cyclocybe aegerita]
MIPPSAGLGERHVHHRNTIRHHLLLKVSTLACFAQRDVESNGGIFLENDDEKPPELQQLEARLTAMRSYDCGDDDPEYPLFKRSEPFFSRCYFRKTETEDQAKVKNTDELISFNRLIEYFPDYFQYLAPSTTSLLKRSFLLSAFCMDTISHDHMELVEDMPFRFPSFVSCDDVYPESRQDAPISDFAKLKLEESLFHA